MGASKEDEDLARAIALSLEETKGSRPSATASSAPPAPSRSKEDEDLERAIAESLKDLESKRAAASENVEAALKTTGGGGAYTYDSSPSLPATDPNELNPTEAENIRLFAQLVERLEQEAATRGASNVISDSSVQVSFFLPFFVKHRQVANNYFLFLLFLEKESLQPNRGVAT